VDVLGRRNPLALRPQRLALRSFQPQLDVGRHSNEPRTPRRQAVKGRYPVIIDAAQLGEVEIELLSQVAAGVFECRHVGLTELPLNRHHPSRPAPRARDSHHPSAEPQIRQADDRPCLQSGTG
jgi:hypothetical protein